MFKEMATKLYERVVIYEEEHSIGVVVGDPTPPSYPYMGL
jgi:hypothetical protein